MIEELLSAYRLKDEARAGWVIRGVARPESVADHSWGTALLCLLNAEEAGVDANRAIRIAVVHDIAEAEVGDVPRRVNEDDQPMSRAQKARREQEAMSRLADGPLQDIVSLWQEYEDGVTPEAVFVRDMNLIDMCLQALFYEGTGRRPPAAAAEPRDASAAAATEPRDASAAAATEPAPEPPLEPPLEWEALDEFFATARPRIATGVGRRLFAEVEGRYRALRRQTPGKDQ